MQDKTGRTTECRIKEHVRHKTNGQHNLSAIAEHAFANPDHNILFDEAQVLAKTERYLPRIIEESIEIQKRKNNFNRDDSYKLSHTWITLLKETNNFSA